MKTNTEFNTGCECVKQSQPEFATVKPKGFKRRGLIAVLAASLVALWFAPTANADNEAIAAEICAAWSSNNPDRVAALFTQNARYDDLPLDIHVTGRDAIRGLAQGFFSLVGNLKLTCLNSSVRGGHATVEYEFSGIDVGIFGTQMPFAFRGVLVLELHGTKISAWRDYYDFAEILRDLGQR